MSVHLAGPSLSCGSQSAPPFPYPKSHTLGCLGGVVHVGAPGGLARGILALPEGPVPGEAALGVFKGAVLGSPATAGAHSHIVQCHDAMEAIPDTLKQELGVRDVG